MFTPDERAEVAAEVWRDVAEIEHRISHQSGTYNFLCLVQGYPTFTHNPVGPVIRRIV